MGGPRVTVERVSAEDLVELRTDVGPVPQNVAMLLVLGGAGDSAAGAHATAVEEVLAGRIAGVARLRQRLVTPPPGLGRPFWQDDPAFDVAAHLVRVRCPAPGDRDALLQVAADALTRPLDRARPLWRAVLVTGSTEDAVGVVIVAHHVLADGIGGLAVLAQLVDPGAPAVPHPLRPPVGTRTLLADTVARLLRGVTRLPGSLGRLRRGRAELGRERSPAAPRCSLNAPTGAQRRLATVDVDLAALHTAARRHGATLNDLLLVAVADAMAGVLRARGEEVPALVVSVPVSARVAGARAGRQPSTEVGNQLGNQVGVMPVRVAVRGPLADRVAEVAALTRARKAADRGASARLVGPVFRFLAAVGAFRWFVEHQHLVNTFLTNVRGPQQRVALAGSTVQEVVLAAAAPGNVGVSFAALSYAGRMGVTVIADPGVAPELAALADGLHRVLLDLS